ncbi:MAG: AraC family transcriptional regulator [Muribaculaceae bacterium]|nr:AraC family transcriptional regulator [Muribaculaceae bacterium]
METLVEYEDVVEALSQAPDFGQVSGAFAVASISSDAERSPQVRYRPVQTEGMAVLLVLSGSMNIEVNMTEYLLEADSLLVVPPRTLIYVDSGKTQSADVCLLFMAPNFLHEININYAALSMPAPLEKPSPVRSLSPAQTALLRRYFDLLSEVTRNQANLRLDTNIASSLVSAMVYQVAQFHYKELAERSPQSETPGSRPSNYVNEFIRLLQLHYMNERSVTFYAEKLFISPKYLSLLVKKATGRSASRWIDDRVIMEARNLLRYSGKNIQQVAYMLNFSNQSSFGKYFKHLTGMSPTEYQKS